MEVYEKGYFIEENLVEVVIGCNVGVKDEWLKQVMEVIICKLYEVVKELELMQDEWMQVILFFMCIG